jgi:hypothetical protein
VTAAAIPLLTLGCVTLQLHAGDTVRWSCSYNMSGLQPGTAYSVGGRLTGGYSSTPAAHQEQCTVSLYYWPRVESMRGCTAALDDDVLLGENMCSSEAEDVAALKAMEDAQLPIKRVNSRKRISKRFGGGVQL